MNNWININGRYINLDQVTSIETEAQRNNYQEKDLARRYQTCVVFYYAYPVIDQGAGEDAFFGAERTAILQWLGHHLNTAENMIYTPQEAA